MASSMWMRPRDRGFEGLEKDKEGEWKDPFFFIACADTQLGMMHKNKRWEDEIVLAEEAVANINRLKPRFAIVCGDLINHIPELYPDEDPGIRERQVADFKKVFEKVDEDIPLVCVCGNHDVGNRPNSVTIDRYKKDFGDDYFSFWVGGVCCIVVNGNLISDPKDAPDLYDEQLKWFEAELKHAKDAGAAHTICFSHIPWFLAEADETDDGLGMLKWDWDGVEQQVPNAYFHIPKERRMVYLDLMRKYDCKVTFTGHWHQNCVAESQGLVTVITTAVGMQLSKDKSGMRIVRVFKDAISHAYYPFPNMPEAVSLASADEAGWTNH